MAATAQALQQQKQGNGPLILQYLERYKNQIAAALPRHLTPDRMARIVTTEVRKCPKLLECDPKSLFGAVIQASQLGLEPGSALGHCYLLPYGRQVQLIIGYRGMLDLARRSGQIASISARLVYAGDKFRVTYGLHPDLIHEPCLDPATRGEITHAYAVANLVGGGVQWEVMSRAEIDAIRAQSKAANNGPWVTHYEEMARKTVIRRLFKFLPVSIEIQQAVGLDEQADAGVEQKNGALIDGDFMDLDDETVPEPASKTDAIKARLAGGGQQPEPVADAPDKGVLIAKARGAMNEQALDEVRKEAEAHLTGGDKAAVSRAINTRFKELRAQAAEQEPFPPEDGEPAQGEMAGPSYAEIADRLHQASNTDQLDEVLDLIRHLPQDQQDELRGLAARLRDGMAEPA